MSDNPNANTTHFIPHIRAVLLDNMLGIGSAGDAISALGHSVLGVDGDFENAQFAGLGLLEEGLNKIEMTTNAVTRWVGQVGASYIFATIGYNGWATRDTTPIQVLSTGGVAGSCYKPIYALGFVPLIFAAIIVLCWAILMVFTSSLFGCRPLKEAYGGLGPYTAAIYPGASPKDTLLAWESSPQPRLQLIAKGYPVMGDAGGTALKFLKSGHSYP